jgi:Flp pilus assembly protein TadD
VSYVTDVSENFSGVGTLSTAGRKVSEDDRTAYDNAIADFSQVIKLRPNDASAYRERGNAYADRGDYDRAIADYNQAIKLDPDYATAYTGRGAAYGGKKDYGRARVDSEKALQLDPNDATARNNLEVLRVMGY